MKKCFEYDFNMAFTRNLLMLILFHINGTQGTDWDGITPWFTGSRKYSSKSSQFWHSGYRYLGA